MEHNEKITKVIYGDSEECMGNFCKITHIFQRYNEPVGDSVLFNKVIIFYGSTRLAMPKTKPISDLYRSIFSLIDMNDDIE